MLGTQLTCSVARSIDEVEAGAWDSLCRPEGDAFMDRRFLAAVEASMSPGLKLWYPVLYDQQHRPAAIACLSTGELSAEWLSQGKARPIVDLLARAAPALLKVRLLCCGLPIASGESFLRLAPEADAREVLAALDRLLLELARAERARCIVFREFEAEAAARLSPLVDLGYVRVDVPPMNRTRGGCRDFDGYLASLNCDRRRHIKRSQRKFAESGLRVVQVHGGPQARDLLTSDVYRLYEDVCQRHGWFEKVPLSYFHELAIRLPGQTTFTFVYQGERVVAFATSLYANQVYHAMFCGFDYALNSHCDLYFNLFFHIMDDAYRRGAAAIICGKTSDTFKHRRLSCWQEPRCWYVKGVRRLAAWLIRTRGRQLALGDAASRETYPSDPGGASAGNGRSHG